MKCQDGRVILVGEDGVGSARTVSRLAAGTGPDAGRGFARFIGRVRERHEGDAHGTNPIPEAPIAEFCRRHGIQRLELFGSALRDDFGPASDVDVMVVPELVGRPVSGSSCSRRNSGQILGRKVDLHTRRSVEESPNYIFRKHALSRVRRSMTRPDAKYLLDMLLSARLARDYLRE